MQSYSLEMCATKIMYAASRTVSDYPSIFVPDKSPRSLFPNCIVRNRTISPRNLCHHYMQAILSRFMCQQFNAGRTSLEICVVQLMLRTSSSIFVTTLMAPQKSCLLCSSQAGCLDNCALALLALSHSISQQE